MVGGECASGQSARVLVSVHDSGKGMGSGSGRLDVECKYRSRSARFSRSAKSDCLVGGS